MVEEVVEERELKLAAINEKTAMEVREGGVREEMIT